MSDGDEIGDIVERLLRHSDTVARLFGSPDGPESDLLPADTLWFTCREAADEIERLTEWRKNALLALDKRKAEIERLRQRGDNLAAMVRDMPHPISHLHWLTWRTQIDNALMGWEEARRG